MFELQAALYIDTADYNLSHVASGVDDVKEKWNLYGVLMGVGSLGLITNACVLAVLLCTKGFTNKPAGIFIINQTVTDLVTSGLVVLTYALRIADVTLDGFIGVLHCRLIRSEMLLWTGLVASTYGLVTLSLDRYLQIVFPVIHRNNASTKKVLSLVAFSWMLSAIIHVYHIFMAQHDQGRCIFTNSPLQEPLYQHVIIATHTVLIYLLPMTLLAYCYSHIIISVRRRFRSRHVGRVATTHIRAEVNVAKTFAIVAVLFIVCWTPSQLYCFLFALREQIGVSFARPFTDPFYRTSLSLAIFNICLNPFVYTYKYREFQLRLRQILQPCVISTQTRSEELELDATEDKLNNRPINQ